MRSIESIGTMSDADVCRDLFGGLWRSGTCRPAGRAGTTDAAPENPKIKLATTTSTRIPDCWMRCCLSLKKKPGIKLTLLQLVPVRP